MKTPIIDEVRQVRQSIFRSCDNDLAKLVKRLERRRKELGLKVVRRPRRKARAT